MEPRGPTIQGSDEVIVRRLGLVMIGLAAVLATSDDAKAGGVLFQELPNAFGTQPCSGGGCYTRYLSLADIDGDQDLDVLLANGGFANEPLVVYENDGEAGFTNVSASAVGGYVGNTWQIAVGDIDADGDLDVYAPDADGDTGALFVNDGTGGFDDEADARLPAEAIATESVRFGDLDADGDLDIVVAGSGSAVYLNDGDGVFEELDGAIPNGVGFDVNDIDLFDADRDWDLDLLTNDHGGNDLIWLNDGAGNFEATAFSSSGGLHYGPGVCDIDGDTDLDIWIDNQGPSYTERLWANQGDATFEDVTVAQVMGNPNSDDNGIVCADTDSDGDLDAIVVALSTPERLLVNDGDGNFTYQAGAFSGPQDSTLWAEMGDLNGDHRIDIATGEGESGSFLDRVFLGTDLVPEDGTAPRIIMSEDPLIGDAAVIVRFAVSDDALSDHGPRLSAAYAVIDPAGEATQIDARFVGGDIFRVELPTAPEDTEVVYRLCAVDWNENEGCTDDLMYGVGGSSTTDTGADTGVGTDTDAGTETDPDTGTDAGTDTQPDPDTDTATDADADADAGDTNDETGSSSDAGATGDGGGDDGCGCTTSPRDSAWTWLGVLALLGRRRRCA